MMEKKEKRIAIDLKLLLEIGKINNIKKILLLTLIQIHFKKNKMK